MFTALIFLITCVTASSCAKILCVFPIPLVSHLAFHHTICKELSLKGHQVTVLTPIPSNDNFINLTEIKIENIVDIDRNNQQKVEKLSKNSFELFAWWFFVNYYGALVEETIIQLEVVFPNHTNFDLLIVEALHSLVYSLGCKFKTPIVAFSSLSLTRFSLDGLGNFQHPLLFYEKLLNENVDMYEKICRLFGSVFSRIYYHWIALPELDKRSKKYFGKTCPYIEDIQKNVSLLVVNTNPILNLALPNVAALVEVGGFIHIQPKKPLPQDLQNFLDQSSQGVVYFSLGSAVKLSALSKTFINMIVEALGELPYNVLLKWEEDLLPNKPDNVMVKKWFPQQDILGHKNIKTFVTQGGLQSIEEAIANSVPLVVIPFYADQPSNVIHLKRLKIAQDLDYSTVTKNSFKEAIIEVAENDEYKKRIEEIKDLIQDQPMKGLEKAVWWIEYVLRHQGANHLKSVTIGTSWFGYFMVELIAAVVIVFVFLLLYFVNLIVRKV